MEKYTREVISERYLAGKRNRNYKDIISKCDTMQPVGQSKKTTPSPDGLQYESGLNVSKALNQPLILITHISCVILN